MKFSGLLERLHRDEKGTVDVQTLLVIGAVVLPIVAALIFFQDKIREWLFQETEKTTGGGVKLK